MYVADVKHTATTRQGRYSTAAQGDGSSGGTYGRTSMKNRLAVAQRSAGRLQNADHSYQSHTHGDLFEPEMPAADVWIASCAGELFPGEFAVPSQGGRAPTSTLTSTSA